MTKPHFTKLHKRVISKHILTSLNKKNTQSQLKVRNSKEGAVVNAPKQINHIQKQFTKHLTPTKHTLNKKIKSLFSPSNFSQFLYLLKGC